MCSGRRIPPVNDNVDCRCATRLLHPGADTLVIITQYISTIEAFRLLDPPGVLLDKVSRPIQKYLKYFPQSVHLTSGNATIQSPVF